jgi:5-methylcytosine-specific restriction endonuclease McrA
MTSATPVDASTRARRRLEATRRWRLREPLIAAYHNRANSANQTAKRLGVEGRITRHDVQNVVEGSACVYCGTRDDLTIDHIVPLSRGGLNVRANLQSACKPCNSSKWIGDHPWRWSRTQDACSDCGTTQRRHEGRGLCGRCYQRRAKRV